MDLIELKNFAQIEMAKWGLTQKGWVFDLDNAKRRLGVCNYRDKTIKVSKEYAQNNEEKWVKDTVLHEIAHALTPGHNHDRVWKQACIKVGARPKRGKELTEIKQTKGNWKGTCDCKSHWAYRKGSRMKDSYCNDCKSPISYVNVKTGEKVEPSEAVISYCETHFGYGRRI